MDQKNRLIIAIAVTLLIVAAKFTSFGRSLFSMSPAPPPAARRGEAPLSPPSCSSGWR